MIASFIHSWETLIAAVNRLLYFASGIYYSPILLPESIRSALAWNPILQGVEWFRTGFYGHYDPPWVDQRYMLIWCLASLLIGMSLFRVFRNRLAVHR